MPIQIWQPSQSLQTGLGMMHGERGQLMDQALRYNLGAGNVRIGEAERNATRMRGALDRILQAKQYHEERQFRGAQASKERRLAAWTMGLGTGVNALTGNLSGSILGKATGIGEAATETVGNETWGDLMGGNEMLMDAPVGVPKATTESGGGKPAQAPVMSYVPALPSSKPGLANKSRLEEALAALRRRPQAFG